jgi:hypothetical protein
MYISLEGSDSPPMWLTILLIVRLVELNWLVMTSVEFSHYTSIHRFLN